MNGKVILVVEDDYDERTIYTTLFRYRGYEVLAADGFAEAMRLARERPPDVAVVDVNLGEGSPTGCDLVLALRQEPRTASIPVIVHTAYGDIYRRALELAGCDVVVHKPSDPRHLLQAVQGAVAVQPAAPGGAAPAGPAPAGGLEA